jgi:hypothetical protein
LSFLLTFSTSVIQQIDQRVLRLEHETPPRSVSMPGTVRGTPSPGSGLL